MSALDCITDVLTTADLLHMIVVFIGAGNYRYITGTCRAFKEVYDQAIGDKNTTYNNVAASVPCATLCVMEAGLAYKHCRSFVQIAVEARVEKAILSKAGQRGVIAILDWYLMRAGTVVNKPYLSCALEEATKKGHIHVLHWMKENELHPSYIKKCWNVGAVCGHVHVLDWLYNNGYKIERQIVHKAALLGNISVLEWCLSHQVKVNYRTSAAASYGGQLNALKWLQHHGCPWDGNVIYWAEERRHHEVLEWAHNNGCPTHRRYRYVSEQLEFNDNITPKKRERKRFLENDGERSVSEGE